ncbi:MAG: hypothetical protein GX851_00215 [Clostridiales bacterium]|nr:hypothetical protein [Clostridiales bacterium]
MKFDFTNLTVCAGDGTRDAAELFTQEIQLRTGARPQAATEACAPCVVFSVCEDLPGKDSYKISLCDGVITLCALGIRGLIYAFSMFLRKTVYENGKILLIKDISGVYTPDKRIRGHQLGYRTTPNSYDAWDYDQYYRYYRDLMFFGANTCEHIPNEELKVRRNRLMKYEPEEFLPEASRLADTLDMDVSLWYPNNEESIESAVKRREALFEKVPRVDAVFPPGGDPGEFYADEFLERCIAISKGLKRVHPAAQMWPSAQKPHTYPDWGEAFIEELEKLPDEIDGVITGPNHALPMDELRRRLPMKYPIRFYPDITHNVRCEYPVHFERDDWHYALASTLSRESINPRPTEFRLLHRITRRYVVGSVSYSEGVSDDINKMVWSDMDFFPETVLTDTLEDYSRVFFFGAPAKTVAEGILALERNWEGDPLENPGIDNTCALWEGLSQDYPFLNENWRFLQCLFRAKCDALVRRRRIFESELVEDAKYYLAGHDVTSARRVLETAFPVEYDALRAEIFRLGDRLFEKIGLQLDVEHYCADSWERGATLETIDQPVTDRKWLLNRMDYSATLPENERGAFIDRLLSRNTVESDEYYFSLAEHGFGVLGVPVEGEFYINFQGDRPNANNGSMPMSMLKVYDHYQLRLKTAGFAPDTDYVLKVAFKSEKHSVLKHHHIIANGVTVYDGPQFGGESDEQFDRELLAPGFETASYVLPASVFVNDCLELEIGEPYAGVKLCELWIKKRDNGAE